MKCYAKWGDLPDVCKRCIYRDSDSPDEYTPPVSYCTKNLILPTKSGKCKKALPKANTK